MIAQSITLSIQVHAKDDRTNLAIARGELSRKFGWDVAKHYIVQEFKELRKNPRGFITYRVRCAQEA